MTTEQALREALIVLVERCAALPNITNSAAVQNARAAAEQFGPLVYAKPAADEGGKKAPPGARVIRSSPTPMWTRVEAERRLGIKRRRRWWPWS